MFGLFSAKEPNRNGGSPGHNGQALIDLVGLDTVVHIMDKCHEVLKDDEARIYELIVRRFMAVFLPTARWDNVTRETVVAGETFIKQPGVLVVGMLLARRKPSKAKPRPRRKSRPHPCWTRTARSA